MLFCLVCNQPVVRSIPSLPHMHANACSNVSRDAFLRTKSHSAQPTQRLDTGLLPYQETPSRRLSRSKEANIASRWPTCRYFNKGLHLTPYATCSTPRDCECGVSTSPKVRSCLPLASSPLSSGGHADQRTQVLRHRCMPHQMGSTANRSFHIFLRLTPRAASALKHSQWHPRTCARFCTLATKQNAQPNQYSTSKCPLVHF